MERFFLSPVAFLAALAGACLEGVLAMVVVVGVVVVDGALFGFGLKICEEIGRDLRRNLSFVNF